MALDYFHEPTQILNPAKCATCGEGVMVTTKPDDDSVWDTHPAPQNARDFSHPAVWEWTHTGDGDDHKAARADMDHTPAPHDGRSLMAVRISTTNMADPEMSEWRKRDIKDQAAQDADFGFMSRHSGLMSKAEQKKYDAENPGSKELAKYLGTPKGSNLSGMFRKFFKGE